jgi:hypothetical protein
MRGTMFIPPIPQSAREGVHSNRIKGYRGWKGFKANKFNRFY